MRQRPDRPESSPRMVAMDALARREYSRHDLRERLMQRFPSRAEDVDKALAELETNGLLSDERFAEVYARSRVNRGQGLMRIRHELRTCGVTSELIEDAIASLDVDWLELAAGVLVKRFGTAPPSDAREKARRIRFLQQRGFGSQEIREVIESLPIDD